MNRRDFLTWLGAGALGPSVLRADHGDLPPRSRGDYKALVCIYLAGGADSVNFIPPRSDTEYATYAAARGNLAEPKDSLLPIHPLSGVSAGAYGMHSKMVELHPLFESGKLAIVANTGSLLEPLTKAAFVDRSGKRPPHLFAHNHQTRQWSTGAADAAKTARGWGGRTAEALRARNGASLLSPVVSLSGISTFATGENITPFTLGSGGVRAYSGMSGTSGAVRRSAFERILRQNQPSRFMRQYAAMQRDALQAIDTVQTAVGRAQPITTVFPNSTLGKSLHRIAELIAARVDLGMERQVFFARKGGWDTHASQLQNFPNHVEDLSQSIAAFQAALAELGVEGEVTTFTASEFGRTLTSNGRGSDHGWGGHQLVLGGAVEGQRIYGTLPDLQLGGPDTVNRRHQLLPTTSVDQYAATLAKWFGLGNTDLDRVFPNLGNFTVRDLGFLRA